MSQLTNPHDAFFKEVFSGQEAARDFMAHYLPAEIAGQFDLTAPEIIKDSFVDETLRTHFSDILYRVALKDGSGTGYVYVLFEHKSYPDRQVAFQLLRYLVRIWEQRQRQDEGLAFILPVVIYHGAVKWSVPPSFGQLFHLPVEMQPYLPDFRYWLCDLSRYSDEEIVGAVKLQTALLLLKYILRDDLGQQLPGILKLLNNLSQQKTALAYLETILRYVASGSDIISGEDMQHAVTQAFPTGDRIMTTIAEKWVEQGIQQGIQQGIRQGIQQGIQQGMRQALLDGIELGLELKFGVEGLRLLPEIRKIDDVDVLRAIHAGLKPANTLDELRRIYA